MFLFDEPLSNLDAALRVADPPGDQPSCIEKRLATTVYVTHDQVEAMTMADRMVVMNHGTIEQVGTPQGTLNHNPATRFVADPSGPRR